MLSQLKQYLFEIIVLLFVSYEYVDVYEKAYIGSFCRVQYRTCYYVTQLLLNT